VSKILFISPEAFGYYKKIISTLELNGHEVRWLHQIPSENAFVKAFIRLFPFVGSLISNIHFNRVIAWHEDYDYVLVIKGEGLSHKILTKMRSIFNKAEFVFYNWDSLANSRSVLTKLKYFDRLYSFDDVDCSTHTELTLLPLFYENLPEPNSVHVEKYEVFFAGTIHSDRFSIIKNIVDSLAIPVDKTFLFFFYQSRTLFIIQKLFKKTFSTIPLECVSFKKKDSRELFGKMLNSNVVIDIANFHQNGLTMRSIEAVGAKCKLITNNRNIKSYAFYNTNNVFVLDDVYNIDLVNLKYFMIKPYECLSEEVYKELEIGSWVNNLVPNAK
jgi:hypothetical protein